MKANMFEKMLINVAPGVAYKRAIHKMAVREMYSNTSDANVRSIDRFGTDGWMPVNGTGESVAKMNRDVTRAQARDLEIKSDMMPAEILAMERNVVGTGIVLQVKIKNDDGEEDDELNAKIEELWKEWCKPENCDIQGRMSFDEFQEMSVRRRMVDGGILVIKVYENRKFKLQMREVDDLDTSIFEYNKNQVVGGIELNEYGKAIAYHLKQNNNYMMSKSDRFPADRVCYLSYIIRPSQVREVSPLLPSISRIDDANQLIDSAVMKERVLSYIALFITNSLGTVSGIGRGISSENKGNKVYPTEALEQGMIKRLNPGEDIKTINPSGVSSTANDMLKTTQRLAGSSVGLSYESVSRDMSQSNYSSARQGMLEDHRTYKRWQNYLITHLCEIVYQEWLDWIVISNQITLPNYFENKSKYQKRIWVSSGWDWIDPLKEAKANREALDSGQRTLQDICAANGKDYKDVIKQRAVEIKMFNEMLGVSEPIIENDIDTDDDSTDRTDTGNNDIAAALNGAQIDSLLKIAMAVASGELSYESALQIIITAYPIDQDTASSILNNGKQIEKIGDDENA